MKTLKVLSVLLMLSFCFSPETSAQSWKELKKAFKEAKNKVKSTTSKNNGDEIILIVSGNGSTKEEATKSALRSAIEQAYGAFVSANTAILNDELVKDEIVTVASGNIKSYNELFCNTTSEGKTTVSLEAKVSISNLINYAKSKGSEAEFAGATFAMNLKMKELNKKNEEVALNNLLIQVKELFNNAFDYELSIGDPILSDHYEDRGKEIYELPLYVTATYNDNLKNALELIWNTLNSLSLNQNEVEEYKTHKMETGLFLFGYTLNNIKYGEELEGDYNGAWHNIPTVGEPIDKIGKYKIMSYASRFEYWQQPTILNELELIFHEGVSNFIISDNLGGKIFYEKEFNKGQEKYYYPIIQERASYSGERFICKETKGYPGLIIGVNPKHKLIIIKKIPASELGKYTNFEVIRKQ